MNNDDNNIRLVELKPGLGAKIRTSISYGEFRAIEGELTKGTSISRTDGDPSLNLEVYDRYVTRMILTFVKVLIKEAVESPLTEESLNSLDASSALVLHAEVLKEFDQLKKKPEVTS